MPKLRADQALIHVSVPGSRLDKLPWTSMDGGDISATDTKTRDGFDAEESLGGPKTCSNLTVTRQYTNDVLHPLVPQLEQLCGENAMTVSWTPVDGDQNPNGDTHGRLGRLIGVSVTKRDRNGTEAMFLTLEMSCTAKPMVVS